ncbi:MAPEG family protein [Roseivivax sp. THAF40]|uniref:MAPEG family protein n=1 Tax=unclassified Roseivivax TaxID=2639302 RepID=UPI0012688587|nr:MULTISPECIES: MAPEG family protein [unclassified Roseivivax]QFS81455.1 MAPEG family protein [Roseivivax sp. THAF197b]QFT45184.1 MAPEG family protein [Roseivivax sp. THAF40]
MTPELTALTLAALLQCLTFVVYAIRANLELGPGYTMSARDREPSREMGIKTARLQRAIANHFEGLILFGIAVMVVTYADVADAFTALASALYLLARILYVPAYYFGLRPWRSLIWSVGWLATVFMLIYALF